MKVYFIKNDSEVYLYENDRIIKSELKKERAIYTSIICFKDIFVFNFKLPIDLSEDEVFIEAEKNVFKESGLDFSKEYVIKYNIHKLDNFYLIDAFIVEKELLEKKFNAIIKKIKYIDFITPSFLVYSSYYDLSKKESKNDAFIYLDESEAYISFFRNKKFLFVKSIDKLSKLARELNISFDELKEILETKGLNRELYDDLIIFEKVNNFFSQFFVKVNNLINYSVNIYGLEKIDNIYFYSKINIKDFIENIQSFWATLGINFELLKINSEYDSFDVVSTYFNAKNYENEDINFSVFKKPPPIFKQEVGKFIIFIIIFFMLFIFITGIEYFLIQKKKKEIIMLNEKIDFLLSKNAKIINMYKNYIKKIKSLKKEIFKLNAEILFIENKLLFLNEISKKDLFLQKFNIIIKGLDKFNLQIDSFNKSRNRYEIVLKSRFSNSKSIAKYVVYLIDSGFKNVYTKKILNKDNTYSSKVIFND